VIKPSDPHATPQPGYFYPWVLPGSKPGAQDYQANIAGCNTQPISLGTSYGNDTSSYASKPGNMIGPTKKGVDSLLKQDPGAHWVVDPPDANGYSNGHIEGSKFANPMDSPRVMLVPLTDPKYVGNGKSQIQFNNMTLMFIESFDNAHGNVNARFIRFATGTGSGPVSGSLIKTLRLVQ
jgi:hypothetical protein